MSKLAKVGFQTDCHDITEILLKVALNTIVQTKPNHNKRYQVSGTQYTKSELVLLIKEQSSQV
jgi:hypothetical protein